MQAPSTIPLFPLGVVLMPHMPLPLHIFEERYKTMIGECLAENKEFGVVYFNGKEIGKVGCTAQIVEVLKRYENGEMDIVTVGNTRFFIKELYDAKPYLEASVVYFDDRAEEESEALATLARQGLTSLKELNRVTGGIRDYGPPEALGLKRISFLIAGIEGFTPAEKQRLLEMTSTRRRLESGVRSLRQVFQRALLTQEIQGLIGGNGNIKRILKRYDID
ncbi:MAG: LON peptidase substrate-binding domain-containing protein [Desulfobacterales bacterium]|nr:MAG: LON peptidase substrate-binding domain-containing protein [Desulfobacterales bacterium]